MVNEELSRRAIALSVKAGKLTARALALILRAALRRIQEDYRAHQTPHGRQRVGQLMRHGQSTSSIELTGAPQEFDRVARRWNVDYAFYKTGPEKYLLFFKAGQADAITACFAEYSKRVLARSKSRQIPIREQLDRALELVRKEPRQREPVREVQREDR